MVDSKPGIDAWKEHAIPFDRVLSVSQSLSTPRPASWIATEAAVSESAARSYLERLVELSILLEYEEAGTVTYGPDPLYVRFQIVRELLDEHDFNDLVSLKEDLQAQTETWRDKYEVGSPDELKELATGTDNTEQATEIRRTATEWEVTEYRLSVVKGVIDNYDTYRVHQTST